MTALDKYVSEKYDGKQDWFVEEVNQLNNQQRILDVQQKKSI
ncbi:hypothetical protein [Piscibacillus salipiscarius]|nr:hypothetical protein [Piscibacillus salipiscarius]